MADAAPPGLPADWPHRAASRLVACPPHRWHVQDMGAGPVILLLHGAGGAGHSWRALMPLLAARGRVIVPDLPGQGFTRPGRRRRFGLEAMAEDLAALCAHMDAPPDAIIGHSAGAALALRMAEILPRPPRAVVGINAALGPFEGLAGLLFPLLARTLTATPFVPALFARLTGTTERVRALLRSTGSDLDPTGIELYRRLVARAEHVDGTLGMMAQWRLDGLMARLPQIAVPVLLIAAAGDRTVPAETSARAAARMPMARHAVIERLGHLVHEEAPDSVAALITDFLDNQGVIARSS